MAKVKEEPSIERVYVIPLRQEWLKVPKYKRAKKAIKAIREFVVKHMKSYERELDNVKINDSVNKAIWCRGIKSPPHKITVKVTKKGEEIMVDFVNLPKKFKREDEKLRKKIEKARRTEAEKAKKREEEERKKKEAEEKKKAEEAAKTEEEKKKDEEKKEKEKALHKETDIAQKQEKQLLKLSKKKDVKIHRMAMQK